MDPLERYVAVRVVGEPAMVGLAVGLDSLMGAGLVPTRAGVVVVAATGAQPVASVVDVRGIVPRPMFRVSAVTHQGDVEGAAS